MNNHILEVMQTDVFILNFYLYIHIYHRHTPYHHMDWCKTYSVHSLKFTKSKRYLVKSLGVSDITLLANLNGLMTDLTLYLPNYNAPHSSLFDEVFAVSPSPSHAPYVYSGFNPPSLPPSSHPFTLLSVHIHFRINYL